jgi:alpha-L-fucosidase
VLNLQPGLITNNRLGGGMGGDLTTPEQFIPATGVPGKDFEVCMTMNDTWGYKSYDNNWKSSEELVRKLIDSTSKGGNFLLNVGPTSEGLIPQPSVERLKGIGRWMQVNKDAIYGTTAGPFPYLRWGRAARKGSILYLYVFDWPKSGVLRVRLKNKVTASYLPADPTKAIPVTVEGERISLKLPTTAPDPIASVIALRIEGGSKANRPQSRFRRSAGPVGRRPCLAQELVPRRPLTGIMKRTGELLQASAPLGWR